MKNMAEAAGNGGLGDEIISEVNIVRIRELCYGGGILVFGLVSPAFGIGCCLRPI